MKKYQRINRQGGQSMITAVIFFLTISAIILVAMATPVATQVRMTADFLQSKQGYIAADTLNEEAIYRLNKNKTFTTLALYLNGATSTAVITDIGGDKQIISTGIAGSFSRSAKSVFSLGDGLAINYGLQVGNGGLTMSGSPTITGNVYANGNISGSGVSTITGSAVAAVATQQVSDQQNSASGAPAVNMSFASTTASQDFAQSFTVSTSTAVAEVSLYIRKNGSPANATVKLMTNSSGNPSSTVLASGTMTAGSVTTSYGWVDVGFTTNPSLTPGTTYWLVIDMPSNATANYYTIGATNNNSYAAGQAKLGRVGSTWVLPNANYDGWFRLYVGGVSSISGVVIGSGGSGSANAFEVFNSTVSGPLYCQYGSGNNKACDTSQPTASFLTTPFSSANVEQWQADATSGGTYNGNFSVAGASATSTGPKKIIGNLSVGGSGVLTVNGTLYVTGNLDISGAGKMKLASSYGGSSGTIVVDGTVNIAASGAISGSGQAGSYVVIVSNSTCGGTTSCGGTYAISISGAAGAVVLLTQNGGINFDGSAGAKAAIGYRMNMTGATTLTYESGLSDINFTSGPSGAWNISSWQEI